MMNFNFETNTTDVESYVIKEWFLQIEVEET